MDQEKITDAFPFLFEGETLFFIAETEPDNTVATEEARAAAPIPELPQHQGDPQALVQICVSYDAARFIPENEYELLSKILNAVQVPIEKTCIWNQLEIPESEVSPKFIIFFSTNTENKYIWQEKSGTQLLFADPLYELAVQVPLKKKLWAALQQADFSAVRA